MTASVAYLCSQYPAVSHTFINREIEQLQALGFKIHPFSMRPGEILEGATAFEQAQFRETFCIHRQSLWNKLFSQISQFFHAPLGYTRGLFKAVALQKGRPKESLWALFHFLEAAILARTMRKRRVTHVHAHFAGSETAIAMYAHLAFDLSFSFTLHGPDVFYNVALGNLAEKVKRAAFIICISHFARSQALRLGGVGILNKCHIVRCGVDPDRYVPVTAPRPQERPFIFVCTGRLTPTKGQTLLVLACAALAAEGRPFRCVLIGGGEEQTVLENMIREHGLEQHVILTGALPQDGVLTQLSQADLFVLFTYAEGVPVVLMEAMSMEIPCISTRVGGIAELIEDGVNSWLLHAGDHEALTVLLRKLMDDPGLLPPIGKAARATILKTYHIRKNAEQLAKTFQAELS